MRLSVPASVGLLCAVFAPSTVQANDELIVIYSEVATDASSQVLGAPGFFIDAIDRFAASPNGQNWAITLQIDTGNFFDDELLVVNGVMVAREGSSPSFVPPGRALEVFDATMRINDLGAYAFSGEFNGNTVDDDFVARGVVGGGISLLAREGDPLTGAPAGWLADTLDSAVVTNGSVGYEVDSIDGGPGFADDNALMLNQSILVRTGVDAPAGQMGGGSETWETFDRGKYWVSNDGLHHLIQGDLTGNAQEDHVIVVNGQVVLQERFPIPGSGLPDLVALNALQPDAFLADSGDWMAEGQFLVSFRAWAVYNGIPVALQDSLIHPGATEIWDAPFHAVTCNSVGDYVVVGSSDATPGQDQVVVFNGQRVVARQGDPVDLDGNGLFDDNVYVEAFGENDFTLTNDRKLFFTGLLMDGSGATQGDFAGYIQIDGTPVGVPFCQPANLNCNGTSTTLSGQFGTGLGSDLHLSATHGPSNEFGYFLVSAGFSEPGIALSRGRFCLLDGVNPFGRYNVNNTSFNSIGIFSADGQTFNNLSGTGTSAGNTGFDVPANAPVAGNPLLSGSTWNFQLWHRDSCAAAGESNFSNGLSVTIP